MSDSYDVIIIGSGPAGYVCAIKCAQLGLNTAVVEVSSDAKGAPVFGGTCLNVGCIPSKALLDSSHKFTEARDHFSVHGIGVGSPSIDIAAMMKRKDKIVSQLTGGVSSLLQHNGVTVVQGQDMRGEYLKNLKEVGIKVEKHHHEVAPSQHELGMYFGTLVDQADNVQLYKYVVQMVTQKPL